MVSERPTAGETEDLASPGRARTTSVLDRADDLGKRRPHKAWGTSELAHTVEPRRSGRVVENRATADSSEYVNCRKRRRRRQSVPEVHCKTDVAGPQ